jgi:hypothetical protein
MIDIDVLNPLTVRTVTGEFFTALQHAELARLILLRFGTLQSAAAAWRRMMENNCTDKQFDSLVHYREHTPSCKGQCAECSAYLRSRL